MEPNNNLSNSQAPKVAQETLSTVESVQPPVSIQPPIPSVSTEQPISPETPSAGHNKFIKIIVAILAIVIVFSGAFLVYANFVNPFIFKTQEDIFKKSIEKTSEFTSQNNFSMNVNYSVDATIEDPYSGDNKKIKFDIPIKTQFNDLNSDTPKIAFQVGDVDFKPAIESMGGIMGLVPAGDVKFNMESRLIGTSAFFKINKLPQFLSIFIDIDSITNKWVRADLEELEKNGFDTEIMTNYSNLNPDSEEAAKNREITNRIAFEVFEENKDKINQYVENIDGKQRLHYSMTISSMMDIVKNISDRLAAEVPEFRESAEFSEFESIEFSNTDLESIGDSTINASVLVNKEFFIEEIDFEFIVIDTKTPTTMSVKFDSEILKNTSLIENPSESISVEEFMNLVEMSQANFGISQ